MANGVKTPQDEDYYNRAADSYGSHLHAAEQSGTPNTNAGIDQAEAFANDPSNSSEAVKDKEQNPDKPIDNGFYRPSGGNNKKKQKFTGKSLLKRKGPLGAIVGGTGILGIIFASFIGGPALIGIHAKEIMSDFFSDRTAVLQSRSDRLFAAKLNDSATQGACTIQVRCKYRGMTDRMITQLEADGIEVEKGAKRFGKTSVTGLGFPKDDGTIQQVNATELRSYLRSTPGAAKLMSNAYKPKHMAWIDKVADNVRQKYGLTRAKNLSGNNQDSVKESFQRVVVEGKPPVSLTTGQTSGEASDSRDINIDGVTDEIQEKAVEKRAQVLSGEPVSQTPSVSSTVSQFEVANVFKAGVVGALTPLAVADTGCTAYNLVKGVGYGAKAVGSAQLISYIHVIFNGWDSVKAGDATPEEVEFLGNMITSTDADGKSATDSYGYKYVAYGDLGNADDTYKYKVGGGLPDALLAITGELNTMLGGAPDATCDFIKSGWGTAALIITGVFGAAIGIGTGGGSFAIQAGAGAAAGILLGVAVSIATPMLIDLAAGTLVTGNETGADVGNAMTAGMGAYNAQTSQAGGLAPLTKDEVMAYQNYNNQTIAAINTRDATNPLDVYDKDSFAGQVATLAMPTISQLSNPSSIAVSLINLPKKTLASIISPTANAQASAEQYNVCPDEDFAEMNLAADPFCNVRYGINPDILANEKYSPEATANWLYDNEYVNEEGDPEAELQDYIEECITRLDPIGTNGDNNDDGRICLQNNDDKYNYFRMYYIDSTVLSGMDDEPLLGESANSAANPPSSDLENGGEVAASGWSFPTTANTPISGSPFTPPGHPGVDMAMAGDDGAPIYSVRDGVVTSAGNQTFPYIDNPRCRPNGSVQQTVVVQHNNVDGEMYTSAYHHVATGSITVKVGDKVEAGDRIATMGNTGCSFGTHLHFELWRGEIFFGTPVDPTPLFIS